MPGKTQRRGERQEQPDSIPIRSRSSSHKPGALAGSTPLAQWRAAGRWTAARDRLRTLLRERHGPQEGARQMIELLQLGRQHGYPRLTQAIPAVSPAKGYWFSLIILQPVDH